MHNSYWNILCLLHWIRKNYKYIYFDYLCRGKRWILSNKRQQQTSVNFPNHITKSDRERSECHGLDIPISQKIQTIFITKFRKKLKFYLQQINIMYYWGESITCLQQTLEISWSRQVRQLIRPKHQSYPMFENKIFKFNNIKLMMRLLTCLL